MALNRQDPRYEQTETVRHSFWSTVGRAAIAIGTLLGGVAAILTFVSGNDNQNQPSSPHATSTEGRSNSTPLATRQQSPSGPQTTPRVAWKGTFLFDNNGVDLDREPPARGVDSGFDAYSGGSSFDTVGADVAVWRGRTPPTPDECSSLLDKFSNTRVPIDVGTRLCVRTSQGRIAFIEVVRQGDENTAAGWEVRATIWRAQTQ
jgi:hypothetical protein